MVFIEQAQGDQEQTGTHRQFFVELVLDVGLLDGGFALIAGRGDGVLPLELADKLGLVVKPVLNAQHGAAQIGLGVVGPLGGAVVVDFAITGEHGGGALEAGAINRLGRDGHLGLGGVLAGLLRRGLGLGLGRLELADFGFQALQLGAHLFQLL